LQLSHAPIPAKLLSVAGELDMPGNVNQYVSRIDGQTTSRDTGAAAFGDVVCAARRSIPVIRGT